MFLLGPRYTGSDKVKLVCKQYNTYHENYIRLMETLREIYWEAKRAPSTDTTAIKNPYRRETLRKKMFGRTREERLATYAKIEAFDKARRIEVDTAEIREEQEKEASRSALR